MIFIRQIQYIQIIGSHIIYFNKEIRNNPTINTKKYFPFVQYRTTAISRFVTMSLLCSIFNYENFSSWFLCSFVLFNSSSMSPPDACSQTIVPLPSSTIHSETIVTSSVSTVYPPRTSYNLRTCSHTLLSATAHLACVNSVHTRQSEHSVHWNIHDKSQLGGRWERDHRPPRAPFHT